MSDIETALRETLNRQATAAPTAATASAELLTAVRRRRARTSLMLCAATVVAVLGIAVGARLASPDRTLEPAPSPHPRSAPGMVYVGSNGTIWGRADNGTTTDWRVTMSEACGEACSPAQMAWSPDGRTLAVASGPPLPCCSESVDVTVMLMSAGGEDARPLFQCPREAGCFNGLVRSLSWSRDSTQIALTTSTELYVLSLDGRAPDLVCNCAALSATFLPDGRLAYTVNDATRSNFSTEPGRVEAIDLGSRETSTLMSVTKLTETAFSPDGRYLVINRGDNHLSLVDTSEPTPWTTGPAYADGIGVTWSPSGDRFAFVGQSGHNTNTFRAQLWTGGPGQPARLLHQFDGNLGWSPPIWSPDGSTVATYYDNAVWLFDPDTGRLVDTVPAAGRAAAWQPQPGDDH